MGRCRTLFVGLAVLAAALLSPLAAAGEDAVIASSTFGSALAIPYLTSGSEDRITIGAVTNPTDHPISLHVVAYGNGQLDNWKDVAFDCPLTPHETTYLVAERDPNDPTAAIVTVECSDIGQAGPDFDPGAPATNRVKEQHLGTRDGIFFVTLECQPPDCNDPDLPTLSEDVLFGSATVIDFGRGFAASLTAIHIQAGEAPDGDRFYRFDGSDYAMFPRALLTNYIAPDDEIGLDLVLFTPDRSVCSPCESRVQIQAFDDDENPISTKEVDFDCFDVIDLTQVMGDPIRGDVTGHVVGGLIITPIARDNISPDDLHEFEEPASGNASGTRIRPVHGWILQTISQDGMLNGGEQPPRVNPLPMSNAGAWGRALSNMPFPPLQWEPGDTPSMNVLPGICEKFNLEKHTNGFDADFPPPAPGVPSVGPGGVVLWTYLVTNSTGFVLDNLVVIDDNGTPGDTNDDFQAVCDFTDTQVPGELQPGESTTCTFEGTAPVGAACDPRNPYANLATATMTGPGGEPFEDTDPSHYICEPPPPEIEIEKATNGEDADTAPGPIVLAGGAITWTYVVTNIGPVKIIDIVVSDDQLGAISCPKTMLDVGESMMCTKTGTAPPPGPECDEQYANVGTAAGTSEIGQPTDDTDPSHYICEPPPPEIEIEKATNGEDADTEPGPLVPAGGAITWTYVVTNIGPVKIIDIVVSDDQLGAISCPKTMLDVGESMTCTAQGTAPVGLECGPYANMGMATGTSESGQPTEDTDPSHYVCEPPLIDIEKATNGFDADGLTGPEVFEGGAVTWSYVVSNIGQVKLVNVAVSDDQLGAISCPKTMLDVGESMTCTAQGTAPVGAACGQYANMGTATGTSESGQPTEDTDPSHYLCVPIPPPHIDIEKGTACAAPLDADCSLPVGVPGDFDTPPGLLVFVPPPGPIPQIEWTYVVTNDGLDALHDVAVTDDQIGPITCPKDMLAPGESMICMGGPAPAQLSPYANMATVTGLSSFNVPVDDEDPSHYQGFGNSLVAIDIEKATNGQDADFPPPDPDVPVIQVGDAVTWDYVVTNVGLHDLVDIAVEDDNGTPGDPGDDFPVVCPETTLSGIITGNGAGESMTCTVMSVAIDGLYGNKATVEGTSDVVPPFVPETVMDMDPSHYFGEGCDVTIDKFCLDLQGVRQEECTIPPPEEPVCDKEGTLTFRYTGGGCGASNHSQGDKANCEGAINPGLPISLAAGKKDKNGGGSTRARPTRSFQ